jgi:metal-dependent hydrolase (beta-lactamase superfamily II)
MQKSQYRRRISTTEKGVVRQNASDSTLNTTPLTKLVISQSHADRLNGRHFFAQKSKGYSLVKTEKNERFSQRPRLSQNAHQTTGLDL